MAVRRPLKLDGSNNLVEMSDTDIANIKAEMIRQYSLNPTVQLAYSAGSGNLGTIADTRFQAGAVSSTNTSFPSEATTAEPSNITINYNNISKTVFTQSEPPDTSNVRFPVYLTASGDIQSMSLIDMRDTFVDDVITTLTTADTTTSQAATYRIHTATTLAGHTLMSASPVFTDTRPDLTLYTAAGIPETQDQPLTVANYYLFTIDAAAEGTIPTPLRVRSQDNHLQEYSTILFQTVLQAVITYYASTVTGYKIDYALSTSPTNSRGSGMVNTNYTSVTGNYQTRQVGDIYYAQEFPNGTLSTISTTYLTCFRA